MKLCISTAVLLCGGLLLSAQSYALGYSEKYMPCVQATNNQMKELQKCSIKELQFQEKRLKKILKKTKSLLNNTEKELLVRSQLQWLKQREMTCQLRNKKIKQFNFANASCALHMTQSRADVLETRLNNKSLVR